MTKDLKRDIVRLIEVGIIQDMDLKTSMRSAEITVIIIIESDRC